MDCHTAFVVYLFFYAEEKCGAGYMVKGRCAGNGSNDSLIPTQCRHPVQLQKVPARGMHNQLPNQP